VNQNKTFLLKKKKESNLRTNNFGMVEKRERKMEI
jgi:hypothetical protein